MHTINRLSIIKEIDRLETRIHFLETGGIEEIDYGRREEVMKNQSFLISLLQGDSNDS